MKNINFKLIKNNKSYIDKKNIKCIENDKLIFIIDKDKYSYYNDIFERKTENELIIFDLKENVCKVYINGYNDYFPVNINVIEHTKNDKLIYIKYKIETEENVINEIKIEYNKKYLTIILIMIKLYVIFNTLMY